MEQRTIDHIRNHHLPEDMQDITDEEIIGLYGGTLAEARINLDFAIKDFVKTVGEVFPRLRK